MDIQAVKQLQELGFSQYEAQAYIALLRDNPLNGYELARASRIPRPNVYTTLQKLEERGAIVRIDAPEGTRYSPVPPHEVMGNIQAQVERTVEATNHCLEEIETHFEVDQVWNTHGYDVMIEHARAVVLAARKELLLAVSASEAKLLSAEIKKADQNGVKITTLCMSDCERPCPACRGMVHMQPSNIPNQARWLVITADGTEMLASEIRSRDAVQTVRTRQRLLVELASWYIRNRVALVTILMNGNGQIENWMNPEIIAILRDLGPQDFEDGWLGYMLQLSNNHQGKDDQQAALTGNPVADQV